MKATLHHSAYFFACLFLFFLRVWGLDKVGLQEYDSVYNFLVIRQISEGNFENLYQHLSPTFFCFFAIFYKIFPHFLFLEYLNALLSVLSVWFFVHWLSPFFSYSFFQKTLLLLFVGTSTYGIYGTRSLTIEAMSSLLFVGLLWAYFEGKWTYFFGFLGIMLTVNYKILLFFPLLLTLLRFLKPYKGFILSKKELPFFKKMVVLLSITLFPVIFYQIMGIIMGISWKKYLAHWFFVLFARKQLNVWHETPFFHLDIDYYFQYVLFFESPTLLITFFIGIFQFKNYNFLKKKLFFLCIFILLLMSFLAKAPRGILFVLPILYFFAFEAIERSLFWEKLNQQTKVCFTSHLCRSFDLQKILKYSLFLGLIFYQIFLLQTHIYAYTETNYPKIVAYLEQKGIRKLTGTVGINIQTFLPKTIDYQLIRFEHEAHIWKEKGYEYCLIDDYHRLVGAEVFDRFRKIPPEISRREPMLFSPLLYLEHCEFTGMTFREALETQQKVSQDSVNLRLIRVPLVKPTRF